jgi:hypothetical protein
VDEHEEDALSRRRDVGRELLDHRVGGLAHVADDDDRRLAEQRRAREPGDAAGLEAHGRDVVHLGGGVGTPRDGDHVRDGAVAEQLLGTRHEGDLSWCVGGHRGHATGGR